jgi:hypothetical protein
MISEAYIRLGKAARIAAGIAAIIPASYSFLAFPNWFVVLPLASATLAGLGWWFAFRGNNALSLARMKCAGIGGLVLGAVAFIPGYFGPLIFAPNNNLGPLLGIFITGPAGFTAAVWLGVLYGLLRVKAPKPPLLPDGE